MEAVPVHPDAQMPVFRDNKAMKKAFLTMVCVCIHAVAQLNLLSPRDARAVVEQLPEFEDALRQAKCPGIAVSLFDAQRLFVEIRGECFDPTVSSTFIGSFFLDRSTGIVTRVGSGPVLSQEGFEGVRSAVLGEAKNRILTLAESRCLVSVASQAELRGKHAELSIEAGVPRDDSLMEFIVIERFPSRSARVVRSLTVDRSAGTVTDGASGRQLRFQDLDELSRAIIGLRTPEVLSVEDGLSLVSELPAARASFLDGCELVASGIDAGPDEMYVGTRQGACRSRRPDAIACVNLRTGAVLDPRTRLPFTAQPSSDTIRGLFTAVVGRRAELRRFVDSRCSAVHAPAH
jgi:hypothetical protein